MTIPSRRRAGILSWRKAAVVTAMLMSSQAPAWSQDGPGPAGLGMPAYPSAPMMEAPGAAGQPYCPPSGGGYAGFDPYASQTGYTPPHSYERIPEDPFHDPGYNDPAHDFLKDVARNSWFRLEYIQWSLRNPGPRLLGADVSGVTDPEDPFLATERSSGDIYVGKVGSLAEIDLDNVPGIRGTLGIEMNNGTLEWATWYLAKDTTTLDFGEFYSTPGAVDPILDAVGVDRAIYIPLLFQGQIPAGNGSGITSSPVLAYDTSLKARFETSMFGTEANYVWNSSRPNAFWNWRPTVGVRYVNLTEELGITGVTTVPDVHTTTIESKSINNLFGPQAGLRAELRHEWFTVSVTPTLVLAANGQASRVKTNDLFDSTSGFVDSNDRTYEFSPMFNLAVQGKFHIREHMSVYVGYDFLFIHRVSRPFDNIAYNDNGTGTTPAVVLDQSFTDFMLQGLSLGGEFRF